MDKVILGLFDKTVSFVKEYGLLGFVMLFVLYYLLGALVPNLPFITPSLTLTVALVMIYAVSFIHKIWSEVNGKKKDEITILQEKMETHEEKLEEISSDLIVKLRERMESHEEKLEEISTNIAEMAKQSGELQEKLKSITEVKKKSEVQLMERKEANHLITDSLLRLQRDVRADRTFVLEFHNGTHNNAKLDFAYASMQYEEYTEGMDSVSDVFQRMSTSLFKYLDYMIDHHVFFGNMDEVAEIDPKLAVRMKNNGTLYGGCLLLKSGGKMMGVLGVTFMKEPKFDGETVKDIMNKYAVDIADALAMVKKGNEDTEEE